MRDVIGPALAAAWVLLCAPASAGPVLEDIDCPPEPVRIVVLGDSLADGLWGSFFRAFSRCETVTVDRQTAVSDGLARTEPDDWVARATQGGKPDLVVVQIGANDLTNIRDGRTRLVWGEADWLDAYKGRAEALATGLAEVAGEVVWMGLPIVGQERYEESYRQLSALQAAAAEKAGARFVDTHEPTTFGEGQFVMSAEIDGATRQIRVTDQVHFTELGYDLVAGLLRGEVERLFAQRGADAAIGGLVLQ